MGRGRKFCVGHTEEESRDTGRGDEEPYEPCNAFFAFCDDGGLGDLSNFDGMRDIFRHNNSAVRVRT